MNKRIRFDIGNFYASIQHNEKEVDFFLEVGHIQDEEGSQGIMFTREELQEFIESATHLLKRSIKK